MVSTAHSYRYLMDIYKLRWKRHTGFFKPSLVYILFYFNYFLFFWSIFFPVFFFLYVICHLDHVMGRPHLQTVFTILFCMFMNVAKSYFYEYFHFAERSRITGACLQLFLSLDRRRLHKFTTCVLSICLVLYDNKICLMHPSTDNSVFEFSVEG